uniref:Uncharacterized protein n=1 Tax=Plectus sambesii TaxID=2011161 RepID=A0A914V7P4_9BILA
MGNKPSGPHPHHMPPPPRPLHGPEIRQCPAQPHYEFAHHHRHHSPQPPVMGHPCHPGHHEVFNGGHQKPPHYHGGWNFVIYSGIPSIML